MATRITYPSAWTENARCALDALFDRARAERLWFFHGGISGPLWFTPDELQAEQEKGSFIWGADNWRLRSPLERVAQLDKQIADLSAERAKIARKI